jgi:hypothetical protein
MRPALTSSAGLQVGASCIDGGALDPLVPR